MKNETVSEFSHRFVNTQHQLDRPIPGIHRTPSGDETELLYAYTIKFKPEIQKELVSRDFEKFTKLSQLIETAEGYELCLQGKKVYSKHPRGKQKARLQGLLGNLMDHTLC